MKTTNVENKNTKKLSKEISLQKANERQRGREKKEREKEKMIVAPSASGNTPTFPMFEGMFSSKEYTTCGKNDVIRA